MLGIKVWGFIGFVNINLIFFVLDVEYFVVILGGVFLVMCFIVCIFRVIIIFLFLLINNLGFLIMVLILLLIIFGFLIFVIRELFWIYVI